MPCIRFKLHARKPILAIAANIAAARQPTRTTTDLKSMSLGVVLIVLVGIALLGGFSGLGGGYGYGYGTRSMSTLSVLMVIVLGLFALGKI